MALTPNELIWIAVALAAIFAIVTFLLLRRTGRTQVRRTDRPEEVAPPVEAPPPREGPDEPFVRVTVPRAERTFDREAPVARPDPSPVPASADTLTARPGDTADSGDAPPRPALSEAEGPADDLTRIKGLGPKLAKLLADLGVTRFEQIAAWSAADIARIDSHLGRFQGRIERDNWVEQAKFLAKDDRKGFEERFGALD